MIAFHGKQEIKDKYLARVKAHRLADEITKGIYWKRGKGCAVGCTIHSSDHASYETELGIPMIIARLEDGIFEGLPNDLAMTWPERFLEAVPVGADLSLVWPKFAVWLLTDVKQFAKSKESKKAIQDVIDAYSGVVSDGESRATDWHELRAAVAAAYAAYTAADHAADAAAYSAAHSAAAAYVVNSAGHAAAYSAAHSAAHSAAAIYAAYSAGHAAAAIYAAYSAGHAAAAREKARVEQSEKLLEILRSSPTAHGK